MSRTTAIVNFRGNPVEVTYEDMGPETDQSLIFTSGHVIEWGFSDLSLNAIRLTDDEEQSIYEQLKDKVDLADAAFPDIGEYA